MQHYVTYFDRNYLPRALVMLESLAQQARHDYRVYVVCMDELTRVLLQNLALKNVVLVPLHNVERNDEALAAARCNRSPVEYLWTMTATIILRVLEWNPEIEVLTYLDADQCFLGDPQAVLAELGAGACMIHEHRFPPRLERYRENGIYNVGLMCFRNDERGRGILRWWRERCLEWCYARPEDGKFGDQGYLNDWPGRFEGVVVTKNLGVGVAAWNVEQYQLASTGGQVMVNGAPLIVYHFHDMKLLHPGLIVPLINTDYYLTHPLVQYCYLPYIRSLYRAFAALQDLWAGFQHGCNPQQDVTSEHTLLVHRSVEPVIQQARLSQIVEPLDDGWLLYRSTQQFR